MLKIAVFCDSYRNYEGWRNFICREHWDKFQPIVRSEDVRGIEFSDYVITESARLNRRFGNLFDLVMSRLHQQVDQRIAQRANERVKEESQRAEKYKEMLVDLRDLIEGSEGVSGFHCNGKPASWNEVFGLEFIKELGKIK